MRRTLPLMMLLAALLLGGCRRPMNGGARPKVTVSIEPLRWLVEQIAGNRVQVTTLVPRGMSPETYEPTADRLTQLADSRACLVVGDLGFESTVLPRMMQSVPNVPLVSLADSVPPLTLADRSHDPHVWTAPASMRVMARAAFRALCRVDSAGRPEYERGLDHALARIDSVDSVVRHELAHVSHRTFLTLHPSLGYFARDYGLSQLCVNEGDKEARPADLARIVTTARREKVRVFFVQEEFGRHAVQLIAKETGARVVGIQPLGYDWPQQTIQVARTLAQP